MFCLALAFRLDLDFATKGPPDTIRSPHAKNSKMAVRAAAGYAATDRLRTGRYGRRRLDASHSDQLDVANQRYSPAVDGSIDAVILADEAPTGSA